MSRGGWAALPRGAMGLAAVCDCGISRSYSLTIILEFEVPNKGLFVSTDRQASPKQYATSTF